MFCSLLDDAKEYVDNTCKATPSKYSKHSQEEGEDKSEMLYKLSEYIFDLFDANCTEDFKTIEDFEVHAMEAFDGSSDEYTFEQSKLHDEFMKLFENLLEKFLQSEDIDMVTLLIEVENYSKRSDSKSWRNKQLADEILEAISFYTSFDQWAGMMRTQNQNRQKYKTFHDALCEMIVVNGQTRKL